MPLNFFSAAKGISWCISALRFSSKTCVQKLQRKCVSDAKAKTRWFLSPEVPPQVFDLQDLLCCCFVAGPRSHSGREQVQMKMENFREAGFETDNRHRKLDRTLGGERALSPCMLTHKQIKVIFQGLSKQSQPTVTQSLRKITITCE